MMNNPEYILTDEMETIVAATKTALNDPEGTFPVLNYQFGYIEELNETLKQMEGNPNQFDKKFPLIWLAEPFTIKRGITGIFGTAEVDLFIINTTNTTWKARERMDNNYKPVLLPIYRELLYQLILSVVFDIQSIDKLPHTLTKGYYWGENQQTVLNDSVDCLKIGRLFLPIHNKQECQPSKSF